MSSRLYTIQNHDGWTDRRTKLLGQHGALNSF